MPKAKKTKLTRSSAEKLFGCGPSDLPASILPSIGDVARYYYQIQTYEKREDECRKIIQLSLIEKSFSKLE